MQGLRSPFYNHFPLESASEPWMTPKHRIALCMELDSQDICVGVRIVRRRATCQGVFQQVEFRYQLKRGSLNGVPILGLGIESCCMGKIQSSEYDRDDVDMLLFLGNWAFYIL